MHTAKKAKTAIKTRFYNNSKLVFLWQNIENIIYQQESHLFVNSARGCLYNPGFVSLFVFLSNVLIYQYL